MEGAGTQAGTASHADAGLPKMQGADSTSRWAWLRTARVFNHTVCAYNKMSGQFFLVVGAEKSCEKCKVSLNNNK